MRLSSLPRVQFRWIVLAAVLAALLVRPFVLQPTTAAATPAVNVGLVSYSQWTEQLGSTTIVHLVGEVVNNDSLPASLIEVHFNLIAGPVGYGYGGPGGVIGPETVHVWDMGTDVLGPNESTPFQDVFPAPANYDHAEFVSITDTVAPTPPDHNFSFAPRVCLDAVDANHICGTITNNNNSSVDNVRVLFTFYKGNTPTGKLQTIDTDALSLTNNSTSTLAANASADFELIRSSPAPTYTSFVMLGESGTTTPQPPTDVNATPGNASADISWSAPPSDGGRPITRYTVTSNPDGVTQSTNDGSTTALHLAGLRNGVTYTFTVTATNALGTGFASSPSNAVVPATAPDAPTNVTATPGDQSASVQWTAPFDEGRPITRYTVTSSPGGVTATVNGNPPATSATVSGLTNGTAYTFTVTATNAIGTGPASSPSNAVVPLAPPAPQAPGAPTGVAASAGPGYAVVNWTAPSSSGGSAISSYVVTASSATPANGTSVTTDGNTTSAIVGGLGSGTYTFSVKAVNGQGAGPPSTPSNPVVITAAGQFHPMVPRRILDTRPQSQVGPYSTPFGQEETRNVQVGGVQSVPNSGVGSVVLNVTVTNPTQGSFLTVFPTATGLNPPPTASNLNFYAHQTIPNLVVVSLGVNNQVSVFNKVGSVDVIIDVAGWISTPDTVNGTAGQLRPLVPDRLMDTRIGLGSPQHLGPMTSVDLQVSGRSSVPGNASAVVLNVTVTNPTAPSFLTVFPQGAAQPFASNLNFIPGQTIPNRVMVKLGPTGKISIYNAQGNVDVIVDVNGWFTDGSDPSAIQGEFTGQAPSRIMDTRNGDGPIGGGQSRNLQVAGVRGVPAGATAVVLNVTVTNPSQAGFLVVYPSDAVQPPSSDLNFFAGKTIPNLVVVKLGADGAITIKNSTGSADVIVDVLGWYN